MKVRTSFSAVSVSSGDSSDLAAIPRLSLGCEIDSVNVNPS